MQLLLSVVLAALLASCALSAPTLDGTKPAPGERPRRADSGDAAPAVEAKKKCSCNCVKSCYSNCANGFGINPVGQGLCSLGCPGSCGCGSKAC